MKAWVRGDDAKHIAWGDDPTETTCGRPLVKRYPISEANCEDCRNAFLLLNLRLIGPLRATDDST